MNRLCLGVALALCLILAPSVSEGSILSDLLSFDGPEHHTSPVFQGGGEDLLQDDSVSVFVDFNGDGMFDVGEVIWGVVTLSDALASGRPSVQVGDSGQVAFVFSAAIKSLAGANGSIVLESIGQNGGAAAAAFDLTTILDVSVQDASIGTDTLFVGLSTTTSDSNPDDDPLNWTTTRVGAANGFTAGNNWSWELTADLVPNTDDFFAFMPLIAGGLTGQDKGALTITASAFNAIWLPVDILQYDDSTTSFGDLTLDVGTVSIASESQQANGWNLADQSSFYVNAVPEPISLITWAGLACIGAAFAARRRRES